ncbi:DNA-binding IclR family transcriptional regulator [Halarchaeum rubridurum]|nr:IclR family transcriptional regulator [Halarchaeum rubridurum]MBP1954685.1 DNA-binding IclR family transcriptional regulator [Halarchaeum rubridurum]
MGDNEASRIGAVERFGEIIEVLREREPLSSRAVASALDVSKSTAHAYLATMEELEYVTRSPDGYAVSLKFLEYGMEERERLPIVDVAADTIEQLASDTSEAVYLVVEEHGYGVYVDYALGERAVTTHAIVGTRSPLHSIASGKTILAHLPEERVDEIVAAHGLPAETERTIQSREALDETLARVREQGYAINEHEANAGTRAVGAPVVVDDEVVAAIAVAGPAHRITPERIEADVLGEVLAAANEIELTYPS